MYFVSSRLSVVSATGRMCPTLSGRLVALNSWCLSHSTISDDDDDVSYERRHHWICATAVSDAAAAAGVHSDAYSTLHSHTAIAQVVVDRTPVWFGGLFRTDFPPNRTCSVILETQKNTNYLSRNILLWVLMTQCHVIVAKVDNKFFLKKLFFKTLTCTLPLFFFSLLYKYVKYASCLWSGGSVRSEKICCLVRFGSVRQIPGSVDH
jgi:hypothetical protein